MTEYNVAIEESVVKEFKITAKSIEEALELAKKNYSENEFVLDPGELQFKQMAVIDPIEEEPEWIEF